MVVIIQEKIPKNVHKLQNIQKFLEKIVIKFY